MNLISTVCMLATLYAGPISKLQAPHNHHWKLAGLASYYHPSLEGTETATPGVRYRSRRLTAAHRTLPLGTLVEIKSRATGKVIRVVVNDRGPYHPRFIIDLSRAAARALGVDVAEDRHVWIRIVRMPPPKEKARS